MTPPQNPVIPSGERSSAKRMILRSRGTCCLSTPPQTRVAHPSRTLRRVGFHNPSLQGFGKRHAREGHDVNRAATATNSSSTVEERRLSAASSAANVTGLQPPWTFFDSPPHHRVKHSLRNRASAPAAFHPAETQDSPTKTHTPPHPAPTVPEQDSNGRTRNVSDNPRNPESDDS
jgi:hypothetical protein